jgi:DNA-binding transcriptional ArsR family regulator
MDNSQKLQAIFQTLGDANRLRIIQFIADKECSVSEIVQASNLSQPLVSHHLKVLRENQVLDTERKGPFVYYKLRDKQLLEALDMFINIFQDFTVTEKKGNSFCCPPTWK